MPLRLSGAEVDGLLSPRLIVGWVERVLGGDTVEAPRSSLEARGSWLGVMAASGYGRHVVKVVGVYPGNPGRGLPLVRGLLLSIDSETGEVLMEMPAEEPTGWRTAAASALALRLLGFKGGGVLGVIGAGVQARYHLRVLTGLYEFDGVLVYSRTPSRAERLAGEYGGRVASGLGELLRSSDVIVAATTSKEPVVTEEARPGSFIVSVGAPRPVREISDEVLARAGCVLVDSPIASEESEDAARAPRTATLREVLRGEAECRPGDYRVYKSVGTPLLDLAAALAIEEALKSRG